MYRQQDDCILVKGVFRSNKGFCEQQRLLRLNGIGTGVMKGLMLYLGADL